MAEYAFVQENSNWAKIWILITSILTLILIYSFDFLYSIPLVSGWVGFLTLNVRNFTILGMFLSNLIGGLFFIPTPDELIFYYGLLKGNYYLWVLIASVIGYMIAQVANYYLGMKISPIIMNIISKKRVYEARRYINKYGAWGIFLFNFLPFPGPVLTFALGIARYNFTRLFVLTFLGKMSKYSIIVAIFLLFSA